MLRLLLLALCLAVIAERPALAQGSAAEARLVQAFWTYCVATAGEPRLVHAELAKVRSAPTGLDQYSSGRIFETFRLSDTSDPHRQLSIGFGEVERDSGPARLCEVDIPWGGKPEIVAALSTSVALRDETSAVIGEGLFEMNLTRWTIRTGGVEAVVELRLPTYAGAPGRTLTLMLSTR